MKLLLICYECSPYIGSEWAVGWGRLLGAARVAETHVLTSGENFSKLQQARAEGRIPANVTLHTPEPDAKLLAMASKPGVFAYNYKAYHHWQRLALTYMQALHARERFDLVHQVNVCTFREPGYGYELGIPFLWGPVGGSQNFPLRFLPMLPWKEAIKEGLRGLANKCTLRSPRVRHAARAAAIVIAANSTNQRDFRKAFGREIALHLETALHDVAEVDRTRFLRRVADHEAGNRPAPLRLLWSGELHTRKALPVLLRALKQLKPEVAWELDVLGGGSMQETWEAEIQHLGLGSRVRLLGRQAFTDAVAEMQSADLFCFTSLRDTSGNVVLEALAAGVPVICFDHQGAGDMVNAECGIKVPVSHPAQAYTDWAQALQNCVENPTRLLQMSHGATKRAKQFLWSQNHDCINAMYQELAQAHQTMAPVPEGAAVAELYQSVEVQIS